MIIIGIASSPRGEASNSTIALKTALDAAEAKGAEVEIFNIAEMEISDCHGDNYCKAHGDECAIKDGMDPIYEAIKECDALVLASPIYFFDLTARTRAFIDRLYAFYMTPFTENYGARKFSLITTQGMPDESAFKAAMDLAAQAFATIGFEVVDVEAFGDGNQPNSLTDEQVEKAKKIGENLL